eukprot:gene5980-5272_t
MRLKSVVEKLLAQLIGGPESADVSSCEQTPPGAAYPNNDGVSFHGTLLERRECELLDGIRRSASDCDDPVAYQQPMNTEPQQMFSSTQRGRMYNTPDRCLDAWIDGQHPHVSLVDFMGGSLLQLPLTELQQSFTTTTCSLLATLLHSHRVIQKLGQQQKPPGYPDARAVTTARLPKPKGQQADEGVEPEAAAERLLLAFANIPCLGLLLLQACAHKLQTVAKHLSHVLTGPAGPTGVSGGYQSYLQTACTRQPSRSMQASRAQQFHASAELSDSCIGRVTVWCAVEAAMSQQECYDQSPATAATGYNQSPATAATMPEDISSDRGVGSTEDPLTVTTLAVISALEHARQISGTLPLLTQAVSRSVAALTATMQCLAMGDSPVNDTRAHRDRSACAESRPAPPLVGSSDHAMNRGFPQRVSCVSWGVARAGRPTAAGRDPRDWRDPTGPGIKMANITGLAKDHSTILVLDYGSQYTQLIARRIRDAGMFSVLFPGDADMTRIKSVAPKVIILSGGPNSVHLTGAPRVPDDFFTYCAAEKIPVLGICYALNCYPHTTPFLPTPSQLPNIHMQLTPPSS